MPLKKIPMKIVRADVIVTCPGRNFVTLKVVTHEGVYGIGDATLNGREFAVASYLKDHECPLLIGRDPGRIEDIWQFLYKGVYWRRGPVTMSAIAAVDMALWDILGKVANLPLSRLLGGASREGGWCTATRRAVTSPRRLTATKITSNGVTRRSASSVVRRICARCTASQRVTACTSRRRRAQSKNKVGPRKKYLDFVPKLFEAAGLGTSIACPISGWQSQCRVTPRATCVRNPAQVNFPYCFVRSWPTMHERERRAVLKEVSS